MARKITDNNITVGYGGYGYIDWKATSLILTGESNIRSQTINLSGAAKVFLTSASVSVQATRPLQNTYQAPRDRTSVTSILLGHGTYNITGNISFDMSRDNLKYFLSSNKIARNTYFNFVMSDGFHSYAVYQCVWQSISFSASVGSLVTCNISYIALNKRDTDIREYSAGNNKSYFDNTLVAYWDVTAGNCIQSFNINFTQDVSPVYLNNGFLTPTYLRCGNIGVSADFESWESWEDINEIKIGDQTITFLNRAYNMKEFSHAGAADIGKHKFQISCMAVTSPTQTIFTIS